MQKFLTLICLVCLILLPAALRAEALVVYSHRHYPSDIELFARFTEQTGVPVQVVQANAGELIERLRAEGENSPADVLLTADMGNLAMAKRAGVLRPIESDILTETIPEAYRDPENYWFAITLRARVIVYARDRISPDDLSTLEDLADPRWRGRLIARSSSHVYNQSLLASVIAANGEDAALNWARAVRRNMARPPQGNDRDQMRAVARGLADIAIVNTYYMGLMHESPDPRDRAVAESLGVFFPNQEDRGVHMNASGGGVTRASSNPDLARQFLEFLVSEESQLIFSRVTSEFPVVPGVPLSELQESWGPFTIDPLPLRILGDLNPAAVRIFNRSGWE
jgi:iron(III) transport system substrate-binding protein